MKNVGNTSEVITAFENSKPGPSRSRNVYFEGNVLYSYGHHFPLVVRLPNGNTIMNADKYSVTTSKHQRECMDWVDCQIPFSALIPALGIEFQSAYRLLEILESGDFSIIAKSAARWDVVGKRIFNPEKEKMETKPVTEKEKADYALHQKNMDLWIPLSGTRPAPVEPFSPVQERRPEATVFEYQTRCFLSSMDENRFFIVELPEKVSTVEEAFHCLKPEPVREWEKEGKPFKRQGEWFFLEVPGLNPAWAKKDYKAFSPAFVLPLDGPGSNPHTATRGGFLFDFAFEDPSDFPEKWNPRTPVVTGHVDHPEHKRLSLSKAANPRFFAAFRNTAIGAWSASGNVD